MSATLQVIQLQVETKPRDTVRERLVVVLVVCSKAEQLETVTAPNPHMDFLPLFIFSSTDVTYLRLGAVGFEAPVRCCKKNRGPASSLLVLRPALLLPLLLLALT